MIANESTKPDRFQPEAREASFSLRILFEALFRHLLSFVMVAGAVMTLALLWTFATPHKYISQASILVQNARSNVLISAGNTTGTTVMNDVTPEQLNSELEVLKSRDLLEEIVDPIWNERARGVRSQAELKAHERVVSGLAGQLDVSVARQSHVLLVSMTAATAQEAQNRLRSLIAAFLARQRQIARPIGATRFFSDEAGRYKTELAAAQASLAQFQKQNRLTNVTDREADLSTELAAAQTAMHEQDEQIGSLQSRIEADTGLLGKTPQRQATFEHAATLTGAVDELTTHLIKLRNLRTEMLVKYRPDDRMVKAVEEQIAETEVGLRDAKSGKAQDASSDVNPAWQQLQNDLTMTRAQLPTVTARRQIIERHIAETQSTLASIEALSPQFSELQHRVSELDSNYQAYLQKRDEAEIADAMDRQELINFAVVQSPTYSIYPLHPQPKRDTLLGAASSLFLGLIAVFLLDTTRSTVANAAELELCSRYPTLATIAWSKRPLFSKEPEPEEQEEAVPGDLAVALDDGKHELAYVHVSEVTHVWPPRREHMPEDTDCKA